MDESFQISGPVNPTEGDYLSFTIIDGDRERSGRITGTALAMLGDSDDRREVFLANIERIRDAAHAVCRRNPNVDIVIVGSDEI